MNTSQTFSAAALRLIDAGEQLIAEFGTDVSLQQIAEAAGQANKFAVQYHFGSRQGLIDAVFAARLPDIGVRRRQQLSELRAAGDLSLRSLWWALVRPVLEQTDAQGRHTFARFAARIFHSPKRQAGWLRSARLAAGVEVHTLLRQGARHLSDEEFDMRFMLIVDLFSAAIAQLDDGKDLPLALEGPNATQRLITQVVEIGALALQGPASTQLLSLPMWNSGAAASAPKKTKVTRAVGGRTPQSSGRRSRRLAARRK